MFFFSIKSNISSFSSQCSFINQSSFEKVQKERNDQRLPNVCLIVLYAIAEQSIQVSNAFKDGNASDNVRGRQKVEKIMPFI